MDLELPQACSALSGFMSVRPSIRGKKGRDSKDPARDLQGLPRPLISYKHDIYWCSRITYTTVSVGFSLKRPLICLTLARSDYHLANPAFVYTNYIYVLPSPGLFIILFLLQRLF